MVIDHMACVGDSKYSFDVHNPHRTVSLLPVYRNWLAVFTLRTRKHVFGPWYFACDGIFWPGERSIYSVAVEG